jgi:hypothetical protein
MTGSGYNENPSKVSKLQKLIEYSIRRDLASRDALARAKLVPFVGIRFDPPGSVE